MASSVTVLGAGSWGTALAKLLAEKDNDVLIWAFEPFVAEGINKNHSNPAYLTDISLPGSIKAAFDLDKALKGRDLVVSAIPSHAMRGIWTAAAPLISRNAIIVSCTKGIEPESLKLMSAVLTDCLFDHPKENRTVLSGPSFAHEVAMGLPTSVVVAGTDAGICKKVQETFRTEAFLTFTNDDVTGVEVGGAVKNVIAIATGISDGLGFGHNSRAAIITRGLYEMIKIGKALGANPLTFAGLSGIGDLVLTCTADLSRNHTVGKKLGMGQNMDDILDGMKMVAEGVTTAKAIHALIKRHGINAPICDAMYRIIYEGLSPKLAVAELCRLTLKDELRAILN